MSAAESAVASRVLLGLLLIEMGVISDEQLEQALTVHRQTGQLLGEVMVARGYASRLAIQDAVAKQAGFLLEPERGFGSGLRVKLIEGEGRSAPSAEKDTASEESWTEPTEIQPVALRSTDAVELSDDDAGLGAAFDRARAEHPEQETRLEHLERDLEASLSLRVELEARLCERDRRLGELESELETVRADLDQARRPAEPAHVAGDGGECGDDFTAVVERAKSYLAARRAHLQEREGKVPSSLQ